MTAPPRAHILLLVRPLPRLLCPSAAAFVDCQNAKTGLSPYLDGELPRQDAAGIAAHLAQCERCRLLLEELRLVGTALRAQLATHRMSAFGVRSKVKAALALLPALRAPRASAWRSRRIWRRLGRTWLRARAR